MSASTAAHALRQTGHDLPAALVMLKTGANAVGGAAVVAQTGGNARQALELHPKRRANLKDQGK